ncbi:hypothetical protein Cni_G14437 [Canna indica]|uniref:MULE transposase domain-containing protein n=1 Tax=Canna indica TaxID=4628 RepID=A0AAQ3KEY0_9LILI|nr:hypothetical protein Cni_G14437 [Canna indica]
MSYDLDDHQQTEIFNRHDAIVEPSVPALVQSLALDDSQQVVEDDVPWQQATEFEDNDHKQQATKFEDNDHRQQATDSSPNLEYFPMGESDDDYVSTEFEDGSDDEFMEGMTTKKTTAKLRIAHEDAGNETMSVTVRVEVGQSSSSPVNFNETADIPVQVRSINPPSTSPANLSENANIPSDIKDVRLEVGMKFESPAQFKKAIQQYALSNGINVKWARSSKKKNGSCVCCRLPLEGGQLLTAIGRGGNNQMFPIACTIVEGETFGSWRWFLGLLFDDLGVGQGYGLTIISDQQKAVRCTTQSDLNRVLNELQSTSTQAHQDFIGISLQKICVAYINTSCKCEVVTNNISEIFNGYILKTRSKLIIDMLEGIRRSLKERVYVKRELMSKCSDSICPNIRKKLEQSKVEKPLTGKDIWPTVGDTPIMPPHIKKMLGRPKKKRTS